jgi:hypothetical protein
MQTITIRWTLYSQTFLIITRSVLALMNFGSFKMGTQFFYICLKFILSLSYLAEK